MGWYYGGFAPYVRVAKRKEQATREIKKLKKKGKVVQPVIIEGKTIAKTFWGKAWCERLESYSDYENRLPRGRSYVRHGAVIDLQISQGEIKALVRGSSMYKVKIAIAPVPSLQWRHLLRECAGKIDSLIELLMGKFSKNVMEIITHPKKGLFPHLNEIKLSCSCPDWADLCKHTAAVLYGVGARFDERPEDLFLLRQANHLELISTASSALLGQVGKGQNAVLKDTDLSALFGVNIEKVEKNPQRTIDSKPTRVKIAASSKNNIQKKNLKLTAGKMQDKKAKRKNEAAPQAMKITRNSTNKKAQASKRTILTSRLNKNETKKKRRNEKR